MLQSVVRAKSVGKQHQQLARSPPPWGKNAVSWVWVVPYPLRSGPPAAEGHELHRRPPQHGEPHGSHLSSGGSGGRRAAEPLPPSSPSFWEGRARGKAGSICFLINGEWHHRSAESWKLSAQSVSSHVTLYFQLREENFYRRFHTDSHFPFCSSPFTPSFSPHLHTPSHTLTLTHTHRHSHTHWLSHFLSLGFPSLLCQLLVFKQSPRLTSGNRRVPWVKNWLLL